LKPIYQIILGAVFVLSLIALGFFISLYVNKKDPIKPPDPVLVKGDTVRVIEKHYYHSIKEVRAEVKNDTAETVHRSEYISDGDTARIETDIKYFISDSTFSVNQFFDMVKSKEYITDTLKLPYEIIKYEDVLFYEKPLFNFIAGIILAVTIFLLGGG
jgi:hypothetical protein